MLAGPRSKKRKLNEISSFEEEKEVPEEIGTLRKRVQELESSCTSALGWITTTEQMV